jgi:hypothetical protein
LIALIFFRAIRYSVEKTEKTLRDFRLSLAQDETLNLTAKIHVLREEISLREFEVQCLVTKRPLFLAEI